MTEPIALSAKKESTPNFAPMGWKPRSQGWRSTEAPIRDIAAEQHRFGDFYAGEGGNK